MAAFVAELTRIAYRSNSTREGVELATIHALAKPDEVFRLASEGLLPISYAKTPKPARRNDAYCTGCRPTHFTLSGALACGRAGKRAVASRSAFGPKNGAPGSRRARAEEKARLPTLPLNQATTSHRDPGGSRRWSHEVARLASVPPVLRDIAGDAEEHAAARYPRYRRRRAAALRPVLLSCAVKRCHRRKI